MTSATDNRTTELLCKLLDERGIKWKDGDAAYEIEWSTPDGRHCSAMYWKPTFSVLISGCTPEQAIAATLGGGTLTAEHVRNAVRGHYKLRMVLDADGMDAPQVMFDWQAIADELNARAERTCHIEYPYYGDAPVINGQPRCSECNGSLAVGISAHFSEQSQGIRHVCRYRREHRHDSEIQHPDSLPEVRARDR